MLPTLSKVRLYGSNFFLKHKNDYPFLAKLTLLSYSFLLFLQKGSAHCMFVLSGPICKKNFSFINKQSGISFLWTFLRQTAKVNKSEWMNEISGLATAYFMIRTELR
jgi:hypothetical protein